MSWFLKKRSLVDEHYFLWAWVRIAKWVLACKYYFAVAFILESCFSSALHFVFVHVKSNEFFHILKKAWTLKNACLGKSFQFCRNRWVRISLHGIGRERRPNQFYLVSHFCWGLWLPVQKSPRDWAWSNFEVHATTCTDMRLKTATWFFLTLDTKVFANLVQLKNLRSICKCLGGGDDGEE